MSNNRLSASITLYKNITSKIGTQKTLEDFLYYIQNPTYNLRFAHNFF
jgi:hypothetical protein